MNLCVRKKINVLFLLISLNAYLCTANIVAQYFLTQCECDSGGPFISSSPVDPNLDLSSSSLAVCPTEDGFSHPISQGVVLDTESAEEPVPDVGLESIASSSFDLDLADGVSIEHWIKPLDLFYRSSGSGSMVLSEIRASSQVFPSFPNLHCSVSYNAFRSTEMQVYVGSVFTGEYTLFRFPDFFPDGKETDENSRIFVVCGLRRRTGSSVDTVTPFACVQSEVDDTCLEESFDISDLNSFVSSSKLIIGRSENIVPGSVTSKTQILTIAVHDVGLSNTDYNTRKNDDSVFKTYPVLRNDISFETTEDVTDIVFTSNDFFTIDLTLSGSDLLLDILNVDGSVGSIQGGVSDIPDSDFMNINYRGASNFYTSSDDNCSLPEDSVLAFNLELALQSDESCKFPAEPVSVCIVEVNDPPLGLSQTVEVPDLALPNKSPLSFVPGSDVDDITFNNQPAQGGLLTTAGSQISLVLDSFEGQLFTSDAQGNCGNTPLQTSDTVDLENGEVHLCYLKNTPSASPTSFNFIVIDSLGNSNSDTEFVATLELVQLITTCEPEACETTTTKEVGVEIQLIGQNSVGGLLEFSLLSLPSHGTLYQDSQRTQELVTNEVLSNPSDSVYYVPNEGYFNAAADGSFSDGVGKSVCPIEEPCYDSFMFQAGSTLSQVNDTYSIEVRSADTDPVTLEFPASISGEIDSQITLSTEDPITVDSGSDKDMHVISLLITPSADVQVFIPATTTVGVESIITDCADNSFCSEPRTIEGYPTGINNLLTGLKVSFLGSLTDASGVSLLASDSVGQAEGFISVLSETSSNSIIEFVPYIGGGLGVILIGLGALFLRGRFKKKRKASLTDSQLEVNLYGDAEVKLKKNRMDQRKKPAPPTARKESIDPELLAEDAAIEAEIAAEEAQATLGKNALDDEL